MIEFGRTKRMQIEFYGPGTEHKLYSLYRENVTANHAIAQMDFQLFHMLKTILISWREKIIL